MFLSRCYYQSSNFLTNSFFFSVNAFELQIIKPTLKKFDSFNPYISVGGIKMLNLKILNSLYLFFSQCTRAARMTRST